MTFLNKIKPFLLSLLSDHKFNEVIQYFLLCCGKNKLTSKQEFNSVLCSAKNFVV